MNYPKIIEVVRAAEKAYYVDNCQILTDAEYDALLKQIKSFEAEHPESIDPNSPTQRVCGSCSNAFSKVQHPTKMLSLDNLFNQADVERFADNTRTDWYLVEPKLDGLTIVCQYKDGVLTSAVTRGDGVTGEDVTHTARTIRNLPLVLLKPVSCFVRGEVIIPKAAFETLNKNLIAEGKQGFSNPRNAASGSLRQKSAEDAATRPLSVVFYDLITTEDHKTELDKLEELESLGLSTVLPYVEKVTFNGIFSACMGFQAKRDSFAWCIDGAVVKVDDLAKQQELGNTTRAPRWAAAYKFETDEAASELVDVEWTVGRTGQVTPVAVLSPVELNGSVITHASIHNVDYFSQLNRSGLNIGAVVSVYKAAEIIPQVGSVIQSADNGKKLEVPVSCPSCNSPLTQRGPILFCDNTMCGSRLKARLLSFCSRQNMDIQGIGDTIASALVDSGLCSNPSDLYTLTEESLCTLPKVAKLKALSILDGISRSKSVPFHRVLSALGIPSVGATVAQTLAAKFKSMDKLLAATKADMMTIEGIADITADNIITAIRTNDMLAEITKLKAFGLCMEEAEEPKAVSKNITVCITGKLEQPRHVYADRLKSLGYSYTDAITKATTYLVCGEGGGSKRAKAEKLGISVITEEELKRMIEEL